MGGPATIDGEVHGECNNFQECIIFLDGITYCSTENYYQCQKATNQSDFEYIYQSGPGITCWVAGNEVKVRPDWESIKVEAMYTGNKAKMEQNEEFRKKLCSSKGRVIFTKSSPFWNYWNGLIFERIRAELRMNGDEDLKTIAEITQMMKDYREGEYKKYLK